MAQLLRRETNCFEPPLSGFTRVQFPVRVKLWMSQSSVNNDHNIMYVYISLSLCWIKIIVVTMSLPWASFTNYCQYINKPSSIILEILKLLAIIQVLKIRKSNNCSHHMLFSLEWWLISTSNKLDIITNHYIIMVLTNTFIC